MAKASLQGVQPKNGQSFANESSDVFPAKSPPFKASSLGKGQEDERGDHQEDRRGVIPKSQGFLTAAMMDMDNAISEAVPKSQVMSHADQIGKFQAMGEATPKSQGWAKAPHMGTEQATGEAPYAKGVPIPAKGMPPNFVPA